MMMRIMRPRRRIGRANLCCILAVASVSSTFHHHHHHPAGVLGFAVDRVGQPFVSQRPISCSNSRTRIPSFRQQHNDNIAPNRVLSRLFSTTQKATPQIVSQSRRVFVLRDDDGDDDDDDNMKSNDARNNQQKRIADSLSLPILSKQQIMDAALLDGEEESTNERYTHALCVVDYQDGSDSISSSEQYAVAIQPLTIEDAYSSSSTSNQRRKSRRSRPTIKKVFQINPYWIDLCPPTASQRSSAGQPDLLLQAVAPQRVTSSDGGGAVIYDLTAGWAQDSVLLATASGGAASRVVMVERDPIVACLLKDALRRVASIAESTPNPNSKNPAWQQRAILLNDRLQLRVGDARDVLQELLLLARPTTTTTTNDETIAAHSSSTTTTDEPRLPDIIYLDPMFPPRTKTAAVKKGMQILHGLFAEKTSTTSSSTSSSSDDTGSSSEESVRYAEEAELLQLAYDTAKVKVVVKRPSNAPTLGHDMCSLKPSNTVKGSINRWDIYVKS